MASDYGLNFGFRTSDESVRIANGNYRTPASGSVLLCGTLVEIDPASAGYLKQAASAAHPRPGTCGLLLQEEIWDRSTYEQSVVDSFDLGKCKKNRLSVLTNGAGVKVWFKNTASQTRADGRVIDAVTMFLATSMAVGRGVAWDGTKYIDVADPLAVTSIGEITQISTGYIEVLLNK